MASARSALSVGASHQAQRELQRHPGIGPATAGDLIRLRITRIEQLRGRDPLKLYRALCRRDGVRHDPCALDVFMALIHYAETGEAKPWHHYTAARKSRYGAVLLA